VNILYTFCIRGSVCLSAIQTMCTAEWLRTRPLTIDLDVVVVSIASSSPDADAATAVRRCGWALRVVQYNVSTCVDDVGYVLFVIIHFRDGATAVWRPVDEITEDQPPTTATICTGSFVVRLLTSDYCCRVWRPTWCCAYILSRNWVTTPLWPLIQWHLSNA